MHCRCHAWERGLKISKSLHNADPSLISLYPMLYGSTLDSRCEHSTHARNQGFFGPTSSILLCAQWKFRLLMARASVEVGNEDAANATGIHKQATRTAAPSAIFLLICDPLYFCGAVLCRLQLPPRPIMTLLLLHLSQSQRLSAVSSFSQKKIQ